MGSRAEKTEIEGRLGCNDRMGQRSFDLMKQEMEV